MDDPIDPAARPVRQLFSPPRVGPLEIRNRIVSSGHDTVMTEDGLVTDRLVTDRVVLDHQVRAAGGVGMIVVQVAAVHPSAEHTSHVLLAIDDACIPGYLRLAEADRRLPGAAHRRGGGARWAPGRRGDLARPIRTTGAVGS